jgi:hypothetical protein
MSTLLNGLEEVIELIDKWFGFYKQDKKNLEQDKVLRDRATELIGVRAKTVNSIKDILTKEDGGLDGSFVALENYKADLETRRKAIHTFLNSMDLDARPIFMSPAQFDLIQGFLDKTYGFDSLYATSDEKIQNIFSKTSNNYPKRIKNHEQYFRSIIPHIGILISEEPEDITDTVIPPPPPVVDTIETDPIPEETTDIPEEVITTDLPTTPTEVNSNSAFVNKLLQSKNKVAPLFATAQNLFASVTIPSNDEELVIIPMSSYEQMHHFLTAYKNLKWSLDQSDTAVLEEFNQLTNNWSKAPADLYQRITAISKRTRMSEDGSNQLIEPKPIVNHNVVATIGVGEEIGLGAQYSKIDRFVTNEDGRRYQEVEVGPEQLFIKGADDVDDSGIDPYDIIQGGLGDCYFMCSLSALTKTKGGIKRIKEMIRYNNDGTFTVKLYRPQKEAHIDSFYDEASGKTIKQNTKRTTGLELVEVVVSAKIWIDKLSDSGDKAIYATSQDAGELWPLILEKAYAQLLGGYDEIDSGFSQEAFQTLTGTPRRSFDFSRDIDRAKQELLQAYESGSGVTFATPPNMGGNTAVDENGNELRGNAGELIKKTYPEDGDERIVAGHAYALDSIDNGIVKLINPHGNNHIKNLPVDSLHKYFSRVVVDY